MRLDRLLLGRGNDGPFLADSSRPDTPLSMVRLTLNPAHRNGGLTRQHQNNGSFPPVSAACRQTLKNECCERSCSNSCGPISIETDKVDLQQRFLSPVFGRIEETFPHAAVAAAPAAGGGLGRRGAQRQALGPGLLLQRLEHGAGRGGVGGAGGHLHPWFWRHDWLRALVAAARRMA